MAKVRYNLMLNPATIARVDIYCKMNDISRSELCDRLLYEFCNDNDIYWSDKTEIDGQLEAESIEDNQEIYLDYSDSVYGG